MTESAIIKTTLDLLSADSAFTALLDSYTIGSVSYPKMLYAPILPQDWSINDKTVNVYVVSATGQEAYDRLVLRASCRGNTYTGSREIAHAIHTVLNRYYGKDFFLETTVLPTVSPSDAEVDNYNTPVEILARSI
jgi:hypothetical protein